MQVAQAGMLATSQNVTGSAVDGYVRRTPDARVNGLSASSVDLSGTSFAVEGFSRQFSSLLQKQLLTQVGRSAYTAELTRAVAGIDAMLINPDTSISSAMGSFFNAAGSLASDPTNLAFQQSLVGNAKQVVLRVSALSEAVDSVASDARQGFADVLNNANTVSAQLADVNARIVAGQVPGLSYPSADLLDERDRLSSQLQQLLGGSSLLNEDGTASHLLNGVSVVDRQVANRFVNQGGSVPVRSDQIMEGVRLLVRSGAGTTAAKEITLVASPSANPDFGFRSAFEDGKAGAYVELLTQFVPMMERGLNLFVTTLVADSNALMPQPIFGLKTATGNLTSSTDIKNQLVVNGLRTTQPFDALFATPTPAKLVDKFALMLDATEPSAAAYKSAFDNVLSGDVFAARNLTVVATSNSTQFAGLTAQQALSLEGLRDAFIAPLTSLTTRPATVIAGWVQENRMNVTLQQTLENQKNSISGVNLDEEAANLVKYQQLYNASSKLIQTGQQMFDMLLSMLSGR